jgi:2-keto-4-pentenoate hydratase
VSDQALRLDEARRTATPIPPLGDGLDLGGAYAIQREGRALELARGARVVGRKVGLTSLAMQEMLGVDQPDHGYLTDTMVLDDGATLDVATLIAPRAEAEIAVRLGRDLRGAGVTRDDVAAAVTAVAPALEIIDSRIADWAITIVDTIADNASSAYAVIGAWREPGALDLAAVEMQLRVGDERVAGRGDAVLGHPLEPVAWLVDVLDGFGEGLAAGDIVMPGALARALPVGPGQEALASFSSLGAVSARFA